MRDHRKTTIAWDFDGVIHPNTIGGRGPLIEPPSDACRETMRRLHARHKFVVVTARTNLLDVEHYLKEHGLIGMLDDVTNRKPVAHLYPDDRGFRFTGDWEALERAAEELAR